MEHGTGQTGTGSRRRPQNRSGTRHEQIRQQQARSTHPIAAQDSGLSAATVSGDQTKGATCKKQHFGYMPMDVRLCQTIAYGVGTAQPKHAQPKPVPNKSIKAEPSPSHMVGASTKVMPRDANASPGCSAITPAAWHACKQGNTWCRIVVHPSRETALQTGR